MSAAEDGLPSRFFSWLDYSVFGGMLLASALIGIYFAFFAKQKQNTTAEYLMGGKTMGIFPISMSLIARYEKHSFFK
jgi:solute carrier family 5 (sodium-coupled monocarboxylate transporter), member 8/12